MSSPMGKRKIRVLVVDDSVFMGMQIARILNEDDDVEVVGRARDGVEALKRLEELEPDVITLDVEMPGMDGITALKHIMVKHPLPVVMVSSATTEGARATFDALRFGALDVVAKPSRLDSENLEVQKEALINKVRRSAAIWTGRPRYRKPAATGAATMRIQGSRPDDTTRFIGIGAGTGCFYSILRLVPELPSHFQDMIIAVLGVPTRRVEAFVRYLAECSSIPVKDVWEVNVLEKGTCYVCSVYDGVILGRDDKGELTLDLHSDADGAGSYRAVDRLFNSLAHESGPRAVGVVMTGEGQDGAAGIFEIRKAGGIGIVQSIANCMDPSMPLAVLRKGSVVKMLPDFAMAEFLLEPPHSQRDSMPTCGDRIAGSVPVVEKEFFSGYVEGVDIIEYLQFMLLTGRSVVIEVVPATGSRGRIFVRNGNVIHATSGGVQGEQALYACLASRSGSFSNLPWHEPGRITINKPGEFVLMEAARQRDEATGSSAKVSG
jgi:two-component system, chemotaxis family, protein-glutamate methylesterase/glutaminase